jgi:hypothetical protein
MGIPSVPIFNVPLLSSISTLVNNILETTEYQKSSAGYNNNEPVIVHSKADTVNNIKYMNVKNIENKYNLEVKDVQIDYIFPFSRLTVFKD